MYSLSLFGTLKPSSWVWHLGHGWFLQRFWPFTQWFFNSLSIGTTNWHRVKVQINMERMCRSNPWIHRILQSCLFRFWLIN